MKLKKIYLENIRSYKSGEIVFPEGSILLSGDIGSGKTTVLLAISFALFGLQPGQKGSSLLASSASEAKVILDLEINETKVTIERNLKKSEKSITQDSCTITIDGERSELAVTELKAKILELLNYPLEFVKKTNTLYNYTVYSPQEQMKQIILEDPESRLNVLRHIFGIDKYKRIRENLSIITAKLREKSRVLQYEIRDLEESKISLSSQKEFIKLLLEKINEKDKELIEKVKIRKNIENELNNLDEKITEKNTFEKEIEKTTIALTYKSREKSLIEKELTGIAKKIKETPQFIESELSELISEIGKTKSNINALNNHIIEASAQISSLESRQKEDLEKKARIFKIDMCPTCLQNVSDSHKNNILNETEKQLVETKNQLKNLSIKNKDFISSFEKGKTYIETLDNRRRELEIIKVKFSEMESSKLSLQSMEKQKQSLENDSDLLEKHISSLKQSVLEFSKYENLYSLKYSELKIAFNTEKNVEIELAELKKELELTKKNVILFESKIDEKEDSKNRLSKILETEQWLSSSFSNLIVFIEKNIMFRLKKEFSHLFNKWFSLLTTDSFYVNLDETFTPIINQGDYELDYAFLSGGERTAVALAYRLALNQIINSLFSKINTRDLVILDEPTDGFSSQQLDKIRDILQELDIRQLIIVSHEPQIEGFVDNVIRIKKENGESKIVE
ncbi:hypothetical protein AUJ84_00370 [Candidatus Pacearchaeota archaeon CG1_02_32_132]|nr:MAG: hypothetical protein AUJ84_00370 [Candidatus Pacearchaeota archaeon CG1_02_32_132]